MSFFAFIDCLHASSFPENKAPSTQQLSSLKLTVNMVLSKVKVTMTTMTQFLIWIILDSPSFFQASQTSMLEDDLVPEVREVFAQLSNCQDRIVQKLNELKT